MYVKRSSPKKSRKSQKSSAMLGLFIMIFWCWVFFSSLPPLKLSSCHTRCRRGIENFMKFCLFAVVCGAYCHCINSALTTCFCNLRHLATPGYWEDGFLDEIKSEIEINVCYAVRIRILIPKAATNFYTSKTISFYAACVPFFSRTALNKEKKKTVFSRRLKRMDCLLLSSQIFNVSERHARAFVDEMFIQNLLLVIAWRLVVMAFGKWLFRRVVCCV